MMIKYKCYKCNNEIKKIYYKDQKIAPFLSCMNCGGILEKELPDISMSSFEVVESGTKQVELRRDYEKKFKERGEKYLKEMQNRNRVIKKDDT